MPSDLPRDAASLKATTDFFLQQFSYETSHRLFLDYYMRLASKGPLEEPKRGDLLAREPNSDVENEYLAVRWGQSRITLARACEEAGTPELAMLLHQANIRDSIPYEDSFDRYVELGLELDFKQFLPEVVEMHRAYLLEWQSFHDRLELASPGHRASADFASVPERFRFFPLLPPAYLRKKHDAMTAHWGRT